MRTIELVIPDFARPMQSDVAPPRLPALEWLLARGRRESPATGSWRHALLDRAGFRWEGALPLAATIAAAPGHWALASPVCLLAGLETVHVHPAGLLRLDAAEQQALAASFGELFSADGYSLEFRDGQGLLGLPRSLEADTHDPADALGREASAFLPSGTDAAWLRRLLTEIQMWLHDHPVNQARESRGVAPCNALWIWGASTGRLEPPGAGLPALASDDASLRAAWRGAGATPEPLPSEAGAVIDGAGASRIVVLQAGSLAESAASALLGLEANWFAPLRSALAAGAVDQLRLRLGREAWSVSAFDRIRFWRSSRPWHESLS